MRDELTEVDIKKMREEIEYRKNVLTQKLKEDLSVARSMGDLSENYEYHVAKRELGKNASRIRYLENMIQTAVVISAKSDDDKVGLFDTVTIYIEEDDEEMTFKLVTTLRQDSLKNLISKESPIGKAIIGHKAGDRVCVKVNPTYSYYVVIRSFEKGEDDDTLEISKY